MKERGTMCNQPSGRVGNAGHCRARHDQPKLLLLDEPMKNGTIIVEELAQSIRSAYV
jgi:ABC-type branched-subunit amino acid transport system ATPase component